MAVNDSEDYLKKAIDSLISQDLDFKENIQLILVDDGSSDDSKEICFKHQKDYPDNIIFLSQSHLGVPHARNLGLNHATGQYISFMDSDDYLSENALSEVLEFFNKNREKCDVVAIPITNFGRENGPDFFNYKFGEDELVNLTENPDAPQLDFSSCFIKASAIKSSFDCDLIYSEDTLFLYRILIDKPFLGCISSPTYFKRRPYNLSSKSDTVQFKKEYYADRLERFHLRLIEISRGDDESIPQFIQYLLCYDLKATVSQKNLFMCDSDEEKQALSDRLSDILHYIDDEIIFRTIGEDSLRYFMYQLEYDDLNVDFGSYDGVVKSNGKSIGALRHPEVIFEDVSLKNSNLKLSGYFNDYLNQDMFSIEALKKSDKKTERYTSKFTEHHQFRDNDNSKLYDNLKYFEIDIPICEDEVNIDFKALYHANGDTSFYRDDNLLVFSPKIDYSNLTDCVMDMYSIKFSDGKINIKRFDYLFAVVMAIYNTENYLHQSIESVINQTIGFEDNVQLILVDDGSQDSSVKILKEYQEVHPDNIIIVSQENQGQAHARNNGFEHVNAKYVNFLDSDDYLEPHALERAYDFFESHYDETDIVSMPIIFFEKENGEHMLNDKYLESRVIDLVKEPNNPQLHSNSAIFKTDVFGKYRFATNIVSSEDVVVINKILLEKKTLGVINTTNYYYRKRYDESSTLDRVSGMKEFFIDKLRDYYLHLFDYALRKEGSVPSFLKYTLAYDLQWVLKEDLDLLNRQEQSEFWFYLNEVLSYIDDEMILDNIYIKNKYTRDFFLSIKRQDLHLEISKVIKNDYEGNEFEWEIPLLKSGDIVLGDLSIHKIWLDIVDLRDGCLNISGLLNSYFDRDYISIEAVKYLDTVPFDRFGAKYVKYTKRKPLTYLSMPLQYKNSFDLKIPIENDERSKIKIQVNFHKDGDNTNFNQDNVLSFNLALSFTEHVKLSLSSFYKANDNYIVNLKHNTFYISPYSENAVKNLEKENIAYLEQESENESGPELEDYNEIISLRKKYLSKYNDSNFRNGDKEIYLFQDRIDVADDNAYHLFKYACSVDDGVDKYFVLSPESKQFDELSKIGNVVEYGSFKHKFLMLFADKIITTHPYDTVINPFLNVTDQRHLISGLLNYKLYWLQHGVTKDNISDWIFKYQKDLSLIVTVSDMESKSFLEEGYGYDKSIIQNLGFPRFDNLEKNDNKQILIIPTWRKNITGNKGIFISSAYFNNLNSFFNSAELLAMVKKGYDIVFKPHPELLKFIKEGEDITEERFVDLLNIPDEIHVALEESYQDLLNNSSILITDYSSVFFDFAYLKKPVIYYHPENDSYHYTGSYFDYETMGFGDVFKTSKDLFEKLNEYIENNCLMEEEYQKRVDKFFTYTDKNNCRRVYDWILDN